MAQSNIPFLCGGTFFAQLVKVKKRTTASSDYLNGQKESLSEPELFRRLISVYQLSDFNSAGNTLKTYASDFKKCNKNHDSFIKFSDFDTRTKFRDDINKSNSQAREMTVKLILDFIPEDNYIQLARCLLGLIQEDDSIDDNAKFYIYPGFIEKQKLVTLSEINLPNLILGIIDFIAENRRSNNKEGANTYSSWYSGDRGSYNGTVGKNIHQQIRVLCDIQSETESTDSEAQPVDAEFETPQPEDKKQAQPPHQIIQQGNIVNQIGNNNAFINNVDILIL